MMMSVARAPGAGDINDFTPTPSPAGSAMVALERWGPRVWECAAGNGALSRAFREAGHQVVETDINPRAPGIAALDFLTCEELLADEICTNPPFKHADAFVDHALNLGARKVMMLLPMTWLGGTGMPLRGGRVDRRRSDAIERRGLARVHVSARRIPFKREGWDGGKGGGSARDHALFVWERGHVGPWVGSRFDWKDFA